MTKMYTQRSVFRCVFKFFSSYFLSSFFLCILCVFSSQEVDISSKKSGMCPQWLAVVETSLQLALTPTKITTTITLPISLLHTFILYLLSVVAPTAQNLGTSLKKMYGK